ncbi:MAG: glycosyltransferase family 4 protein [Phycisphaerae bacterium]
MKELVFICLPYWPDPQSTSQLFGDLFSRLARCGDFRIKVLCGFPSRRPGTNPALPRRQSVDGVEIVRCGFNIDGKKNLLSRFLVYASFLAGVGIRLLSVGCRSVVMGVTNPPFLGNLLWLRSLLGRFSYHYFLLDVFPDALERMGRIRQGGIIGRTWRFFNKLCYRRAERTVVLGRDMAAMLRRDYGLDAGRIAYVPHWSVMEVARPRPFDGNPLAAELGLKDKFVVQYSGNMGLWHDMDILVKAAHELRSRPDIHFLFIGGGMRRRAAEELSRSLGLTNITWLNFVPKERLPESLSCCHASIISLRAGLSGMAVPCKLYGILASGRAVIGHVPADSEVGLAVTEENCGLVIPPGDLNSLVAGIRELAADRVLTEEMGRRAFAAYQAKYTLEQAVRAFARLLR